MSKKIILSAIKHENKTIKCINKWQIGVIFRNRKSAIRINKDSIKVGKKYKIWEE